MSARYSLANGYLVMFFRNNMNIMVGNSSRIKPETLILVVGYYQY